MLWNTTLRAPKSTQTTLKYTLNKANAMKSKEISKKPHYYSKKL